MLAEHGVQLLRRSLAVAVAEHSDPPLNHPVLERKKLEANDTRASKPAASISLISWSFGHRLRAAVVIMASKVCPLASLKFLLDSTRAGRGFANALSMKGKGTTTVEYGSQIIECGRVLCRLPLAQARLQ